MAEEKVRYSDEELAEFKALIMEKLEQARKLYKSYHEIITQQDGNDTVDTNIQVIANNAHSNTDKNVIDGAITVEWQTQMVPMPSNIGTREHAYKGVKHEEKNN
jgi:hypothetical protein